MKIRNGYMPITKEIQDLIKSEIERTGIGPQRILKGNKEARELGLTSGTIYRIIGKNGSDLTAKKAHIELVLKLWSSI
ncbi:hypothetical protein [Fabibacter pacificus]